MHSWLGWGFCIPFVFCLIYVTCALIESDSMGTFISESSVFSVQCQRVPVSSPENQCPWFQPESSQHWPEMFHLIGFIFFCTKYSFSGKLVGFSVKKGCNQTGQWNYTWTSTLCGFEVLIVTLFLIQHFLDLFEQEAHFECKKKPKQNALTPCRAKP